MPNERRYRAAEHALAAAAGAEPRERWIEGRRLGVRIRILEVGSGKPVVFLHGGPNAAATWLYVAAAAEGLRCLLVDRPGCGLSQAPREVPDAAALPEFVTSLTEDVLDGLDLPKATLVGSSLGGFSALRSAIAVPDRVEGVVLAGCPAFVPGWRPPAFFQLLRTPVVGALVLASPVTPGVVRYGLRQMGHSRALAAGSIPSPMLDWMRAWQRDTATMRNDARMIVACGTRRGGFDPRLDLEEQALRLVAAPCCILSGTDDPVGGEPVVRRLSALLPSATVEMFDGAGHLPWLDLPEAMAQRISAFVRSQTVVCKSGA